MPQFMRGARRSPALKLVVTPLHRTRNTLPTQFLINPVRLDTWGNDQFGDCVSAEEAFAKAAFSVMLGNLEHFISETTVIAWARKHGYLNGATLTDPMDSMIKDGMQADDGHLLHDGPYHSVDWTNDANLSSAVFTGASVKIAVSADQLESAGAGSKMGWVLAGAKRDQNTDHCVGICGFGPAGWLGQQLGATLPSRLNPNAPAYGLYTWKTIGVIDQPSLIAITDEAWLRTPTTPEEPIAPTPPAPPSPPGPTPDPAPTGDYIFIDPATKTYLFPSDWTGIPAR